MTACQQCGVTSRGAFIHEVDGEMLCEDCSPVGNCQRCGRETDETTLAGDYRCRECQQQKRKEHTTRDAGQEGLGRWSQ